LDFSKARPKKASQQKNNNNNDDDDDESLLLLENKENAEKETSPENCDLTKGANV